MQIACVVVREGNIKLHRKYVFVLIHCEQKLILTAVRSATSMLQQRHCGQSQHQNYIEHSCETTMLRQRCKVQIFAVRSPARESTTQTKRQQTTRHIIRLWGVRPHITIPLAIALSSVRVPHHTLPKLTIKLPLPPLPFWCAMLAVVCCWCSAFNGWLAQAAATFAAGVQCTT